MKIDQPFVFEDYLPKAADMPLLFDPLLDILGHIESLASNNGNQGCLIGIMGDWGAGKTSILRAVADYFGKARGWPTIFFEAWKYQDDEQPILPLLSRLQDVTRGQVKKGLRTVLRSLGAAALVTSDAMLKMATRSSMGQEIGVKEIKQAFKVVGQVNIEYYSRYENIFTKLEKLAEDITASYRPQISEPWKEFLKWKKDAYPRSLPSEPHLIIIVDDLDRLLPDRAIGLLESIRFFLMLPRTIVILGINDHVLGRAIEIRYRDPKNDKPYFSGTEFMEKLFQWSVELPSISYQAHMADIHFADVKTLLEGELPKKTDSLVASLDPLTHRKWIRTANRWECYLLQRESKDTMSQLESLWLAIFHECFPEAEGFLRRFPEINTDFMNQHLKSEHEAQETVSKATELACKDRTFFHFPERNFRAISEAWRGLAREEVEL
ncbi:MAG: hypothetical protein KAV83_01515 [Desulfobacterales bacterium]|nr:hypothetical protein [Desulfobacterales bacterium]